MDSVILAKLDNGKLFYYKDVIDFVSPSPESKNVVIETPDSPITVYMKWRFSSNTEFSIAINEDATVTTPGAITALCNADRSCLTEPETKLYKSATGISGGTDIWPTRLSARPATPMTNSPISASPVAEIDIPIKCKPSSFYDFEMNKINGGEGYVDINMWWYEH
jgi:hypothetical protein